MTKSYPDQLGKWVQHQPQARRDRNRVAFLAVRQDVDAALEAGYTMKTVWSNLYLANRIHFGYDTFLKYVHRYRRPPAVPPASPSGASTTQPVKPESEATPSATPPAAETKSEPPPAPTGFVFNPIPNKEELL